MKIKSIKKIERKALADITVADAHEFILDNGVISHNSMFPTTVASGGSGRAYAASSTVFLSKRKEKVGADVVGNVVHVKMEKGRITRENSKVDTLITYEKGLDRWYGMVDLAIESGVWKKAGTRVEIHDSSKIYQKVIYENPEKYFTPEVMEAIDEFVGRKFLYGSAFIASDAEAAEAAELEISNNEVPQEDE